MGRVTSRRRVSQRRGETTTQRADTIVVEPLEIRVNGSAVTVTMRTPGSDFELAPGISAHRGLISRRDDIVTARYCQARTPESEQLPTSSMYACAPASKSPDPHRHPELQHHVIVRDLR